MFKKAKKVVMGMAVASLLTLTGIGANSAFADSIPRTSGWDLVGGTAFIVKKGVAISTGQSAYGDPFFESTGGDVKVHVFGHRSIEGNIYAPVKVVLYEDDGNGNAQYVATLGDAYPNGNDYNFVYNNADAWLDGSNNRAEFFVKFESSLYTSNESGNMVYVNFWD